MKTCENCGKNYQEYLHQCPYCNWASDEIRINKPTMKYKVCSRCGNHYNIDNNRCPTCGSIYSTVSTVDISSTNNYIDNTTNQGSFGTGLVLTLLFGIIACIIILYEGGNKTKEGAFVALIIEIILIILGVILGIVLEIAA